MREHGWPLYTLPDAARLRRHLLSALEHATAAGSAAAPINVVVVGGGSTGVETAGALTSMARELAGPAVTLRVALVETSPRLLNGFSTHSPDVFAAADDHTRQTPKSHRAQRRSGHGSHGRSERRLVP